jgi:hypothetical protein
MAQQRNERDSFLIIAPFLAKCISPAAETLLVLSMSKEVVAQPA